MLSLPFTRGVGLQEKILTQYGGDLDKEELTDIANDPLFTAFGLVRVAEGGARGLLGMGVTER
jgi:hypothetical protein